MESNENKLCYSLFLICYLFVDIKIYQRARCLIKRSLHWIPIDSMGHDIVEVVWCNKSIIIKIGLWEHHLDLFISHIFSKVFSDFLEFSCCDFTTTVHIERIENFVYLCSAVLFTNFGCCQFQKLWETNTTRLIFVKFSKNLVDKLVLTWETQINEGLLEFRGI